MGTITWNKTEGFTLIELMIIVAIIAILVVVALPAITGEGSSHQTNEPMCINYESMTIDSQVCSNGVCEQKPVTTQVCTSWAS